MISFEEGKRIYRGAQQLSSVLRKQGDPTPLLSAYRSMYAKSTSTNGFSDFETWKNTIHRIGLTRNVPLQPPPPPSPASLPLFRDEERDPSAYKVRTGHGRKIMAMLQRGGVVPEVANLAAYEGLSYKTVRGYYDRFVKMGGQLTQRDGKLYATPPAPPQATPEPEPEPKTTPSSFHSINRISFSDVDEPTIRPSFTVPASGTFTVSAILPNDGQTIPIGEAIRALAQQFVEISMTFQAINEMLSKLYAKSTSEMLSVLKMASEEEL